MMRAGVGQVVLIDPDVVELPNIGRQMVYRHDLGKSKVEALASRLRDVNPRAAVFAHFASLDDFEDCKLEAMLTGAREQDAALRPRRTVLCGLTDNFVAQARINRLALRFAVPSLCAQVYAEGRGAEITFTYPGVTPACHRCILKTRYDFYASGHANPITSSATPIFSTALLNALKGFVALMLLHHGTQHPRWGGMLARTFNRNLIQLRLDPDIATTLGLHTFDRVMGQVSSSPLFFGEPIWLPQAPEPDCPDCGGSGDLRMVSGQPFATRFDPTASAAVCKVAGSAVHTEKV